MDCSSEINYYKQISDHIENKNYSIMIRNLPDYEVTKIAIEIINKSFHLINQKVLENTVIHTQSQAEGIFFKRKQRMCRDVAKKINFIWGALSRNELLTHATIKILEHVSNGINLPELLNMFMNISNDDRLTSEDIKNLLFILNAEKKDSCSSYVVNSDDFEVLKGKLNQENFIFFMSIALRMKHLNAIWAGLIFISENLENGFIPSIQERLPEKCLLSELLSACIKLRLGSSDSCIPSVSVRNQRRMSLEPQVDFSECFKCFGSVKERSDVDLIASCIKIIDKVASIEEFDEGFDLRIFSGRVEKRLSSKIYLSCSNLKELKFTYIEKTSHTSLWEVRAQFPNIEGIGFNYDYDFFQDSCYKRDPINIQMRIFRPVTLYLSREFYQENFEKMKGLHQINIKFGNFKYLPDYPQLETLELSWCKEIRVIENSNLSRLKVDDCSKLQKIHLPKAKMIDVSDCKNLKIVMIPGTCIIRGSESSRIKKIQDEQARMIFLLAISESNKSSALGWLQR